MQVKDLIEVLQKADPKAEVHLHQYDHQSGAEDIFCILDIGLNPHVICIKGKFDVDLNSQIVEIYNIARREKQSSDELHQILYNRSITVDEVEEAMGIDSACEYKKYLEENKNG
jgi:hypothetical protein